MVRPRGMPAGWKLAAVLETTDGQATLGWLDASGQSHTGTLPLSDIGWARPVKDGKPGPAPRRMTDVMQQGDVVMVEPNVDGGRRPTSQGRKPCAAAAAAPGTAADTYCTRRAGVARSDHWPGARDGRGLEF